MTDRQLYTQFLKRFPPEVVGELSPDGYSYTEKDSFCFWLDVFAEQLGEDKINSPYRYGFFKVRDEHFTENRESYTSDGEYAWVRKWGDTADQAFRNIREKLVRIIDITKAMKYWELAEIGLPDVVVWKIAFLYSREQLLPLFDLMFLKKCCWGLGYKDAWQPYAGMESTQKFLNRLRKKQDVFEFARLLKHDLVIPQERRFWAFTPGPEGSKWDDFYSEGIMALEWDRLDDLRIYRHKEDIEFAINLEYGLVGKRIHDRLANDEFLNRMNVGDVVIAKTKSDNCLGYGIVSSGYYYDSQQERYKHRRKVEWLKKGSWKARNLPTKSLTDITFDVRLNPNKLRDIFDFLNSEGQAVIYRGKKVKRDYFPLNEILYGPPGTGKTYYLQTNMCPLFMDEEGTAETAFLRKRYSFITFHQKYTYEDFIVGITPVLAEREEKDSPGLSFRRQYGIFYDCCLQALRLAGYRNFEECEGDLPENRHKKLNEAPQYALFIDEINRANISAVFGELISCLEEDKRLGNRHELWVSLPHQGGSFGVPANLVIIGTMNTADRSIALLDIALRRRFRFRRMDTDYTLIPEWEEIVRRLNDEIYKRKKSADFMIGHAFFMDRPLAEKVEVFNGRIIPLLYEYFQNQAEVVKSILKEAGLNLVESYGIVTLNE